MSKPTLVVALGDGRLEPWWWSPVLPGLCRPVTDNLAVDGAADAVVKLGIQLGQSIFCKVTI